MANLVSKILKNNNFLSLANNGLVAVLGFFSFIVLVRSIPTNEFGEWVLFLTTLNFIDMLRFGITRTAIVRFLSGADADEGKKLLGSNYVINISSTVIVIFLVVLAKFLFSDSIEQSGFSLFFNWFPLVAAINLPFNNSLSVLQAKMRFDYILLIRIINVGSFMLYLIVNYFWFRSGIISIMWAYIITNILSSLVAMVLNWDGIKHVFNATRRTNKIILNFGKYTSGTLIGSNLLRSADTFILGLSPFLGTTGVALYSIPLKLTEIIEIPVRSFAMTAFPSMSKASIEGNKELVRKIFYQNAGGLTYLLIPVMIFCFIFAEEFVTILGGADYNETASIFRVFCVYGLLLPIDRFIGVGLDSINKPKQNFIKVVYMTLSNIIGDSIVVFGMYYLVFVTSVITLFGLGYNDLTIINDNATTFTMISVLNMVAVVTIIFALIGIFVGSYYLKKDLDIHLRRIFIEGFGFFKILLKNYKGAETKGQQFT